MPKPKNIYRRAFNPENSSAWVLYSTRDIARIEGVFGGAYAPELINKFLYSRYKEYKKLQKQGKNISDISFNRLSLKVRVEGKLIVYSVSLYDIRTVADIDQLFTSEGFEKVSKYFTE